MRCPHCRGRVAEDAEICPHCKKRLKLELTPELRSVNKRLIIVGLFTLMLVIFGSGIMFSGASPADIPATAGGRRFIEVLGTVRVCTGIAAAVNIVLAREELTDKKDRIVGRALGWVLLTLLLIIIFDFTCTDVEDGVIPFLRYPLVYVSLALHIADIVLLLRLRERTRRAVFGEQTDESQEAEKSAENT